MQKVDKRRLPRPQPIPVFNKRFRGAPMRFGADLLETSEIKNTTINGTKREGAFREFWAERLPQRYGVAAGEVVDQLNSSGPQLDVLVYDRMRDFSFSDGDIHILPAEALLVSIEVKSKLDASEVAISCKAARKLRALCPFRAPLGGRNVGTAANKTQQARYYHCVFAYDTDLAQTNWIKTEARRFHSHERGNEHLIDAVYVLRRGLLNLEHKRPRRGRKRRRYYELLFLSVEFHST
jgi:hypothetical protein